MHELSIATALIEQLEAVAQDNGLEKIDEVHLQVGYLRQVVPEFMQTAFVEAAKGAVAQEAKLIIQEIVALVQCRQCQYQFKPKLNDFLCPKCDEADVEILQGDDIILLSVNSYAKKGKSES